MFYFETRCFSSITVRHNAGQFVENVSTIKKQLGAVSCTLAQFTNKVRKKLGSTQLSELRLGELSIRSGRFYEIKHADCGLHVNFWKFWLVPICFMILSKSYYFALGSPLKNINSWRIISIVTYTSDLSWPILFAPFVSKTEDATNSNCADKTITYIFYMHLYIGVRL